MGCDARGASEADPQLACYVYTGFTLAAAHHSLGKHLINVTLQQLVATKRVSLQTPPTSCLRLGPLSVAANADFQIQYFIEMFYVQGVVTVKFAILMFYHRIFAAPRFQLFVKCYIVFQLCYFIGYTTASVFNCSPISDYWTSLNGNCFNQRAYGLATGSITLCGDLVILAAPMPIVWTLQVPLRQKVALSCILLVGILWVCPD